MTLILGIDPGEKLSALCVIRFTGRARHVVLSETVRDTAVGAYERINELSAEMPDLQVAGLEVFGWQGPRSANPIAFRLARLVGQFEAHLLHTGIHDIVTVTKLEANRAIGITKGKVPKSRVKATLAVLLPGWKFRNEHERDAATVAIAAWQRWSSPARRIA